MTPVHTTASGPHDRIFRAYLGASRRVVRRTTVCIHRERSSTSSESTWRVHIKALEASSRCTRKG